MGTMKPENITGVVRPSDGELVRRAIMNAGPKRGATREQRWVSVMRVFAVGSTSAYHLCREAGVDPEEGREGHYCEGCERALPTCDACGEPITEDQRDVGIECNLHDFCQET